MFENYPDVMMVDDVAEALNVCNATVYKWLHSNTIRHFTVGREFRIPKKAVFDFIGMGVDNREGIPS